MTTTRTQGHKCWPWLMLLARTVLFLFWQAVIAGLLAVVGRRVPWRASAAWWPLSAALGSAVVIGLLAWRYRREGQRYRDLIRFERAHVSQDLLLMLGILVVTVPVAMGPNILLARWLFGDQQVALDLLMRPLPLWAAYLSLLVFPLGIALSELPTYYAYAMPRLAQRTGQPGLALAVAAFWLSAQHVALPFVADWRFVVWRLLMYLPFALMLGLLLRWRPRLLPYLMIMHWLMDLGTAAMVLMVSL